MTHKVKRRGINSVKDRRRSKSKVREFANKDVLTDSVLVSNLTENDEWLAIFEFVKEYKDRTGKDMSDIQWVYEAKRRKLPSLTQVVKKFSSWENFIETAYRVLDKKKQVNVDIILQRLSKFVIEEGRYPTQDDWDRIAEEEGYPPSSWICNHVTSWMDIKRELMDRFPLFSKSKKKIIRQGIVFFELYGKLPTSCEWTKFRERYPGIVVSKQQVSKTFNGWNNFLRSLYEVIRLDDEKLAKRTVRELRDVVYSMYVLPDNELWDELYMNGIVNLPSRTVVRLFSSFEKLLEQAGIKKELVIALQIKQFILKGHKLTVEEWRKYAPRYRFVSYDLILYRFRGFGRIIRFGVENNIFTPEELGKAYQKYCYVDEESIISAIKQGARILGRVPSIRDWDMLESKYPHFPTYNQIRYMFGSWTRALYRAGLIEDVWPRVKRK